MAILKSIKSPSDVKSLDKTALVTLCAEIRDLIITTTLSNGGHLASNLGTVELTVALHRVLNSPVDKIVWDVGHQAYTHKILTGRANQFHTLRKMGGLSGFPKPSESPHDSFSTGHASTAISAALGMARARDLLGERHVVVAVVGDGAFTGGMCFEALNDAGNTETPLVVILNDNEMSISRNVGVISQRLTRARSNPGWWTFKARVQRSLVSLPIGGKRVSFFAQWFKTSIKRLFIDGAVFEDFNFTYLGPVDAHDIFRLEDVLLRAIQIKRPVLVHVVSQKGRGYKKAEIQPDKYHGIAPDMVEKNGDAFAHSSAVVGATLVSLASSDARVVGITAAMGEGTGVSALKTVFPARFFDVGIAEEHAVTLAAGMASAGLRPFVAIYSTFAQRAVDQFVHDVALQSLPVTLLLDRAGLAGEDGPTHHGIYDMAWLRGVPGVTILSPSSAAELEAMIRYAHALSAPCVIRYAKSLAPLSCAHAGLLPAWVRQRAGQDGDIFAVGRMVSAAFEAANLLAAHGIDVGVVNARCIKPLDEDILSETAERRLWTLEDGISAGGFGSAVLEWRAAHACASPVICMGVPDTVVHHGHFADLDAYLGRTPAALALRIEEDLRGR